MSFPGAHGLPPKSRLLTGEITALLLHPVDRILF